MSKRDRASASIAIEFIYEHLKKVFCFLYSYLFPGGMLKVDFAY
jgi:hypothetical protein